MITLSKTYTDVVVGPQTAIIVPDVQASDVDRCARVTCHVDEVDSQKGKDVGLSAAAKCRHEGGVVDRLSVAQDIGTSGEFMCKVIEINAIHD